MMKKKMMMKVTIIYKHEISCLIYGFLLKNPQSDGKMIDDNENNKNMGIPWLFPKFSLWLSIYNSLLMIDYKV